MGFIDIPLRKIGIDRGGVARHKSSAMKPTLALAALASLALAAAPAHATLSKGAKAPAFVAKGAQAGKPITFDLAQALKKG